MVDMHVDLERAESLRLQQVREEWIRAITGGALEQLEPFCQPKIISHVLTPKKYLNFDNVTHLVTQFHQWYGDCSDIQVEHSRVELVGEKLGIFYRFLLQKQGSWRRIEQQLYCTMQDGRIAQLHLLCSGFQPVALDKPHVAEASPARDALLEIHTGTADSASTCAVLTPAIKSKLREMQSGEVLEVRVDDPSAREDIEAWCRLSGNPLLGLVETGGQEMRFLVQKK